MGGPDLHWERALWVRGLERVAGIDEVGRGCLCGPVVAAAVILPVGCVPLDGVRDSKRLGAAQRERMAEEIARSALALGIGAASARVIERLNIRRATHLAMWRALARAGGCDHALVDGRPTGEERLGAHTAIVAGDTLCYSIACASIVAKVARDRLMATLARRYPGYGWERNAGYGTCEHLAALRRLGPTPYHRRTYAPLRAFGDLP